ncbi:7-carboxy-7-deazaguanine synthase QueE [Stieleria magnilauensis]|uniref:7-carboxy-7-deazaguanine synthase n=1 Tax=Stieleria magnilauensis TaxID=2527963 RepID=A0ABX5XK98_9BACT|nr:7-carboxy-7-deazaguanine synthase [Planctomycetes bacterium TBK1r]
MGKSQFSHAPAESTRGPGHAQLLVSETFLSRQGEGRLTGTESFFIRTSGCNLRCWFCDTPYASWDPSGDRQSIESLVDAARQSGAEHVVLTGGEPLLPAAATELSHALMEAGFHLTIETAGTIDKPIPCDLLSLSPKLADSTPDPQQHPRWSRLHEQRRMPLDTMRKLIDAAIAFQLKFVVGDAAQFDEVQDVSRGLEVDNDDVYIMPQGVTNAQMDAAERWLRPLAESAGYQYCDRMQIRWFGNRRGT